MTRGRLNRLVLLPAVLVSVGLLAIVIYPRLQQPTPVDDICTLDDTGAGPSGRTLSLCEVLAETQPSGDVWAVVRVVDADLPTGGIPDHADHDWACARWGLPAIDVTPRPVRIVVQIMAQPFPRGEAAQGITQSIEAYSIGDGSCEWELL